MTNNNTNPTRPEIDLSQLEWLFANCNPTFKFYKFIERRIDYLRNQIFAETDNVIDRKALISNNHLINSEIEFLYDLINEFEGFIQVQRSKNQN